MKYVGLVFAAITAASGCGRVATAPDAAPIDPFGAGQRSGTRLKLRYLEFDGARQIFGIHDAERQESCSFERWKDGNFYCTPSAAQELAFSDDKCTIKVGLGSGDPCNTATYVAEFTRDCDGSPTFEHLYPTGEKMSVDTYFTMDGDGCHPTPTNGRPLYALGPEVSAADLAPGSIGAPEGTGRIQVRFATSPDGLRYARAPAFDSKLGVDCRLQNDGTCRPVSAAPEYYQDPECTTRAAQIDHRCPVKLIGEDNFCGFRSIGAKIQTTSAYFGSSSQCVQVPLRENHSLFDIGAKVELATLLRGPVDNGRRIQPVRFADLDISEDVRMYDTRYLTECYPGVFPDDTAYCYPTGVSVSANEYYSDKSCTTRVDIAEVSINPQACVPTKVPAFAIKSTRDASSCTTIAEPRPVGAPHSGQLYNKSAGSCVPATPLNKYYDVGAPIPQSELAKGALVIDP